MKSFGDRCGSFQEISISIDNEHVCCIGGSSPFINETEGFAGFIQAILVGVTLTPLLKDENQRVTILKNRMIDGSFFDTAGVHSKATGWTIMGNRWSFKKNGFGLTFNKNESVK